VRELKVRLGPGLTGGGWRWAPLTVREERLQAAREGINNAGDTDWEGCPSGQQASVPAQALTPLHLLAVCLS
jgi:hypothetical protein